MFYRIFSNDFRGLRRIFSNDFSIFYRIFSNDFYESIKMFWGDLFISTKCFGAICSYPPFFRILEEPIDFFSGKS